MNEIRGPGYKAGDWIVPLTTDGFRTVGIPCKVDTVDLNGKGLRTLTVSGERDGNGWQTLATVRPATTEEIVKVCGTEAIQQVVEEYSVAKMIPTVVVRCNNQAEYDQVKQVFQSKGADVSAVTEKWNNYAMRVVNGKVKCGTIGCAYNEREHTIITAQQFIAANGHTQSIQEIGVGSWVYCLEDSGDNRKGDVKQVQKNNNGSLRLGDIDTATWIAVCQVRLATQAEIQAAGGIQEDMWKVGDKLEKLWLEAQPVYKDSEGNKQWDLCNGKFGVNDGTRIIDEVDDVTGYGHISNTGDLWLKPKRQCTPIPSSTSGIKIGFRVYAKNMDQGLEICELLKKGGYGYPIGKGDMWYIVTDGTCIEKATGNCKMYRDSDILKPTEYVQQPTYTIEKLREMVNGIQVSTEWVPKVGDWIIGIGGYLPTKAQQLYEKDGRLVYDAGSYVKEWHRKALPHEIPQQSWNHKWKIGQQFQVDGSGLVYTIGECINANNIWITWDNGKKKVEYSIETVDNNWDEVWIPVAPQQSYTVPGEYEVPVSEVRVGDRVQIGKNAEGGAIERIGQWGTINKIVGSGVTCNMENGQEFHIWTREISKVVRNSSTSETKSNNQNNQKQTSYVNQECSSGSTDSINIKNLRSYPKVSEGYQGSGRETTPAKYQVQPQVTEECYREDKRGSGSCSVKPRISTGK